MECHQCGRSVQRGDRFCNGCGTSLQGVTDTTEVVAVVDDTVDESSDESLDDLLVDEPVWAPTEPVPVTETSESFPTSGTVTEDLPLTEAMPAVSPADEPTAAVGVATEDLPTTEPLPTADAPDVVTEDLPATEPITEVWMDTVPPEAEPTPYDFVEQEPVAITGEMDASAGATATMPAVAPAPAAPEPRFRFGLMLFVSLATGVVSLIALFANVLSITSDTRLVASDTTPANFRTGTWIVDDLADNLSVAGLIAVAGMVAGGIASGFRWRWGSGLAGGAGLAMAGLAALTVGLTQFPIDAAHAFARVPTDDPFVLTVTRDLGYWLMIAAGALGVVLFFASTNDAIGDRRAGLNPWIAALGGLAIVVTSAGPLLPENQAIFSDNWYLIEGPGEAPALLLVGRLVQLGLFLIGGVIGFLSVKRWGLGVAMGVSLPALWLVISTLLDLTDDPVGIGFRNPGAVDMHIHGVTIIGTSAVLAMLVLAVVGAYDQGARERR